MALQEPSTVEFTLQMAFKKGKICVDSYSLTMSSLIDIACVFVDEKFPDHRQRDLRSCIALFHHNLNSDNMLTLVTSANDNFLRDSVLEVVVIDTPISMTYRTDSSLVLKVQTHQLYVHSYKSPHFCDYCDVMLFGLIQQGLKCRGCGMNFHKRCAYKIPNNCQRTKTRYSDCSSASFQYGSPTPINGGTSLANSQMSVTSTATGVSTISTSSSTSSASTSSSSAKKLDSMIKINGRPLGIEDDIHNRIKIPHTFLVHSYKRPTVCKQCKNLLYGFYKQGYRCKDCYFNCHKKCAPLVPKNCQGEVDLSKPDEIVDSDEEDEISEMSPHLTPGGNVPLQRLVESIRRPCRSYSRNIIKECWMIHFTNTKHERFCHYWKLSTKSISIFRMEKNVKPIMEILLTSVKNVEISKDPQTIDATRNPHVFEIYLDNSQIFYVGEAIPLQTMSTLITSTPQSPHLSTSRTASTSDASTTSIINPLMTSNTNSKGVGKQLALTLQLSIRTALAAIVNTEDQKDDIKDEVKLEKETIDEERNVEKFYKMYCDDVLGSGQFGTVFGGLNRATNKEVAIKIIEKIKCTNKVETQLTNEFLILQNLKHSGVVNLYEMFETPNKIFVVMEKLYGDMLEMILNSEIKRFPERLTKFIVSQILVALKYLHSKCIVHCDLKPENVLLASNDEFPQIKLCDFGFARIIGEKSFRRSVVGTPAYLPPEVLQSKGYNRSLDMWSVGVIVYVSLSGTFPFNDDEEIVEQITNASFMYPANPWNTLSKDATEIVRQLLNVNTLTRLTVVGALRHSWISEDYQCWADLRTLEKKVNERYLTHPLDDERWEKYYEKNDLDHWIIVGKLSLNSEYELPHEEINNDLLDAKTNQRSPDKTAEEDKETNDDSS